MLNVILEENKVSYINGEREKEGKNSDNLVSDKNPIWNIYMKIVKYTVLTG